MAFKDTYNRLSNNMYVQFFYGTIGIYISAFIGSIVHEKLLKQPYESTSTGESELFQYAVGLVMFPYLSGWITGTTVQKLSGAPSVKIPTKNLIYCAGTVFTATLTYNIAIVLTSYPIVIMVKSCSILSVIIVGVFCSRVKDKQNKLGSNKLIVGALVTTGIVLFNLFGQSKGAEKTTSVFGIILLLVSLIADGFLPDFQAQIKTVYKPAPYDLMAQTNKWIFFACVIYSIAKFEFFEMFAYIYDHPYIIIDILNNALMNNICQFFVYYMIQKFRQHIVPFIITIRKIFSVVLSIIWFNHQVNYMQWLGIVVVLIAAVFDFVYQKYFASSNSHTPIMNQQQVQKSSISMYDQVKDLQNSTNIFSGEFKQNFETKETVIK